MLVPPVPMPVWPEMEMPPLHFSLLFLFLLFRLFLWILLRLWLLFGLILHRLLINRSLGFRLGFRNRNRSRSRGRGRSGLGGGLGSSRRW